MYGTYCTPCITDTVRPGVLERRIFINRSRASRPYVLERLATSKMLRSKTAGLVAAAAVAVSSTLAAAALPAVAAAHSEDPASDQEIVQVRETV